MRTDTRLYELYLDRISGSSDQEHCDNNTTGKMNDSDKDTEGNRMKFWLSMS